MATTKQSYELKLLAGFVDEDDRTITVPDPVQGITWSQIQTLATKAAPVLIGDKYQAQFSRFKRAYYRETTIMYLDTES